MIGYDTYIAPKLKECISKVVLTKKAPSWITKKLLEHEVKPIIFKIDDGWQKND